MRSILTVAIAAMLGLPAVPATASAAEGDAPEQRFTIGESTPRAATFEMTARGTVTIEPDGRVSAATLDMPRETRQIYLDAIRRWTFQPVVVDGQPARVLAHFMIEATARPVEGSKDQMQLGFDNVWFLDPPTAESGGEPRSASSSLTPPRYPQRAAVAGYGGTVDVLVKLDSEGRVFEAGVANLALGVSAIRQQRAAETFARLLAEAAVGAARSWTVSDPGSIEAGSAIIPVSFHPPQRPIDGWQPRIPLEVTPLPWMVAVTGQAVAFTPGGEAASSRIKPLNDISGTMIN